MRLTSLSLYAAIWLTSTTFALVARPSNLQARADTNLEFPESYNAQTCPVARSSVTLTASPAKSKTFPPPAWAPAAPKAAMTRRVLPQAHPAPFCEEVAFLHFTGDHYIYSFDGRTLETWTPVWLTPGVYVVTVIGDSFVRGMSLAQHFPDYDLNPVCFDNMIQNNPTNFLRHQFIVISTASVLFRITFYEPNVSGTIALFQIATTDWQAASERAGVHAR